MKYGVRLINNYTKECCGNHSYSEVIACWKFDTLVDAMNFYNNNVNKYGEESRLGQWLELPSELNEA
jgi:hypothetical protein